MTWKNVSVTRRIGAAFTVAGSLIAATIGGTSAAENIESPDYEVLRADGDYEVRRYAPYIVAETTVEAEDQRAAANKAFMTLAGYIFGANTTSDKIAMTAPVTSSSSQTIDMTSPVTAQPAEQGEYKVRFSMPSKWTLETLPEPLNEAVTLRQVDSYVVAVTGYSGEQSADERDEVANRLSEWVIDQGWRAEAGPIWAGYDGPDVPEDERRYEVMLPIADRPDTF